MGGSSRSRSEPPTRRPPRIESVGEKKLVGMHRPMSFDGGQVAMEEVGALWRDFRSRISEVEARMGPDFISMRIYEEPLTSASSADSRFEHWAAVEVSELGDEVAGMARHSLAGGMYAVFIHRGPASAFADTARHIYGEWLPGSIYELDDREHFEVLGPSYRPDDPEATEEVWIPVRPRRPSPGGP